MLDELSFPSDGMRVIIAELPYFYSYTRFVWIRLRLYLDTSGLLAKHAANHSIYWLQFTAEK